MARRKESAFRKKRVVKKRKVSTVKRKGTGAKVLERDQWSLRDIQGMDEVMGYVTSTPSVNRGIILLNIGRHKGRVRVRRDHVFRKGDIVWVKYSGERDLYNLVGVYDKRGKRRDRVIGEGTQG